MKTILIAVVDDRERSILENYLSGKDYEIVAATGDGHECHDLIIATNPDMVIMNLCLPGMDAIEILERLREEGVAQPASLVLSYIQTPVMVDAVTQAGAWYYMMKPYSLTALNDRIGAMVDAIGSASGKLQAGRTLSGNCSDIRTEVATLLNNLGVPTNLAGYRYLQYAIVLCVQNTHYLSDFKTKLYPQIMEYYGVSYHSVEKGISRAVEHARNGENASALRSIFPVGENGEPKHITNKTFVTQAVEIYNKEHEVLRRQILKV